MPAYHHPAPETFELSAVLRALADPARLDIVRHLERVGEANCATLIGTRPKSSMSHHFQVLRESGILHTRIEGVQHRNSLRRDELNTRFPGLLSAILQAS
ncbi:ArsR/SmtB family transcription factor [Gluconobacter kanchanaburiensis]|uniref:Transcriptional regulator n=1 Tax=Gluconobacter kanchanaburiensis NBRC 103587 TaxID=1307948 RepID=A0A511B7L8_9PROT|nr:helix-turn-helix domain-containing protein [Gluconobacter kanchanaburiensis]MBF0862469.1 helix-turn-helix transcriptional regulator [Gluconobacter kanchanaburiensis]GBR68581.1 ArsR family transcriptional regulator [Gluconobacter kanchanaburiensis NBRC 103587]GEK96409.1 transcriptional regulator [Gluconobacter kanchanaburiensis NBRC 103587]